MTVYSISNSMGHVFYVNKRPNKNVLMELCMKEWSWSKEEFEQSHEEISIEKIKIIDLIVR